MEENNNIFLADGDALVWLVAPIQKNVSQHLFGAIHLVGTYLRTNFLCAANMKQISIWLANKAESK